LSGRTRARFPQTEFFCYTPSLVKARALAIEIDGHLIENIFDMPNDLDWYLLGFKPQSLNDFSYAFKADSKIISILAGVNTKKLRTKFNLEKIIRLMPNTPSAIGAGANLFFVNEFITTQEAADFISLFMASGSLYKMITEEDLDSSTPFSGSGPALLFEIARIFENELSKMTGGAVPAREIIAQTFFGAASLMQSEMSFEELKEQVTSKKGVTHEALEVLKNNNLEGIFGEAFHRAYKRTIELSQ
jgi:pyrroline-5-carboxylate reductase